MYNPFQLALKYFHYFFTASNGKGHGIHSPFVFHFIHQLLNDKTKYPEYERVEKLRHELLINQTVLNVEDPGAGSRRGKAGRRTIASITKRAVKPRRFGQLLFRMVRAYQPKTILEMGTSLGVTSAYLSLANPGARLTTLEGSQEIAAVATKNFETLHLENISLVTGNFDDVLEPLLGKLSSIDFAFIDGNHRQEPAEQYFNLLLQKTNNESILIFDDIHWSREMEQAWKTIRDHSAVRCSIDLFFMGIVFFRKEFMEKQHFTIRF